MKSARVLLSLALLACTSAPDNKSAPVAAGRAKPSGGFDPTASDIPALDTTVLDVFVTNTPEVVAETPEVTVAPVEDIGSPVALEEVVVPDNCVAAPEYCDGKDNDCDGTVDEGVLSACGDCNPRCGQDKLGGLAAPLDITATSKQNVIPTENGGLTLSLTTVALQVIWVSNSGEGTVSKLDTATGRELGRYRVCADPSRTGVSKYGDGWIACRSDNALVAYIWNHDGDCTDSNANGVIETSRDGDGDNKILGGELLPQGQDECVRWTTPTSSGDLGRAMGVDFQQHGWVGHWNAQRLVRLSPETGAPVAEIPLQGRPYGLVIDLQGIIWVASREQGMIERADPATLLATQIPCTASGCQPYGIATDEYDRIWIANLGTGAYTVERYDPNTGQWAGVPVQPRPRGLVGDKHGKVFVALDEVSKVEVIDVDTMASLATIDLGLNHFPLGMAVDADDHIWAVNQSSGSITKIDATSHSVIGEYPVGAGPYTYSDMTGSAFFDVVQKGNAVLRFVAQKHEGLSGLAALPATKWTKVVVTADTPGTSLVEIRLRTASTAEALLSAPWSEKVGPLGGPVITLDPSTVISAPEKFLDVEVRLHPGQLNEVPTLLDVLAQYEAAPAP